MGASVSIIGSDEQVEYRLTGHTGCGHDHQLDYRLDAPERPMRWIGEGVAALGLEAGRALDAGSYEQARAMMRGVHPVSGEQLLEAKTEIAPAGKLAAVPLYDAVVKAAAERGVEPVQLFPSGRQLAEWGRLERGVARLGEGYRIAVKRVAGVLDAAALNPDVVYGGDVFDAAAAHAEDRVVVGNRGYDVTVTLPKSFSVLWAFADEQSTTELEDVLERAALDTLGLADESAGAALRGHHGDGASAQRKQGQGLSGWMVVHRTARPTVDGRAGDPHLHAHLNIANMIQTSDGKWSTIGAGGRDLFNHVAVYGEFMTARARALTEQLGLRWARDAVSGQWEVIGISRELVSTFSKRGMDVTAMLDKLGISQPSVAQRRVANAMTRESKGDTAARPDVVLREQWRAEAGQEGQSVTGLVHTARAAASATALPAVLDVQAVAARLVAGARPELTATDQSFTRRAVLAAVAAEHPAGVQDTAELNALAEQILHHTGTVRLPDATSTATQSNADRYTTSELIETEADVCARTAGGLNAGRGIVDRDLAAAAAAGVETTGGFGFSAEQQAVFDRLTGAGHAVEAVIGVAGSGKTTLMNATRQAWEASGLVVAGVATAAVAAENLRAEAGIAASTVTQLLHDQGSDGEVDFATAHLTAAERLASAGVGVLVIDEAGMLGTREFRSILRGAELAGVKVVAIGDPKQLASPSPAGFLPAVHGLIDGLTLAENRRQRSPLDRVAVALWRDADFAAALRTWQQAGDVVATPDRVSALAGAVAHWRSLAAGYTEKYQRVAENLLLASSNSDVAELNQAARIIARSGGELTGTDVTFRLAGGGVVAFAVGDVVMTRTNDYRAWKGEGEADVLNGRRGYVESIDKKAKTITISWRDSTQEVRTAVLTADYIAAGGLEHGYAMTVHKAQGQTADHVAVLGDGLAARAGYTGLTRHRNSMRLFLPGDRMLPANQFNAEDLAAMSPTELTDRAVSALVDKARAEDLAGLVSHELIDPDGAVVTTDRPLPAETAAALQRIAGLTAPARTTRPEPEREAESAPQPGPKPAVAEPAEPVDHDTASVGGPPATTPAELQEPQLLAALTAAQEFYQSQTPGSWVPDYLAARALPDLAAGYAPAGWSTLTDHLRAAGIHDETLLAAGVATTSSRGNLIDVYRDRLVLPITTSDGQVVSFTARAHPDTSDPRTSKYINGPTTAVYRKAELPYGLNPDTVGKLQAGADLAIVEGPFDAEAVNQAAAEHSVDLVAIATASTALTAGHLDTVDQLAPLAERDVIAGFDQDSAGRAAAVKAHRLLDARPHVNAHALDLPGGTDPAQLLAEQGSAAVAAALAERRPLLDVTVDQVVAQHTSASTDNTRRSDQLAALAAVLPVAVSRPDGTHRPIEHVARQADRLAQALTELHRSTVLNATVTAAAGEEWLDRFDDNSYADGTAAALYLGLAEDRLPVLRTATPAPAPAEETPAPLAKVDRRTTLDRLNRIRSTQKSSRAPAGADPEPRATRADRHRPPKPIAPEPTGRNQPNRDVPPPVDRNRDDRNRRRDDPGLGR
ncbi:MobF family relaxase [Jatrophihabitans lederbergiae]|uniref:MobF family relaxase n=1 Tax=Jatrophihabitans lederbergiae TaxID=3075547 RepID=A0ABU2JH41_9ACTN|nr:MobF family relaxase [Jatrophihabitans sp. DSM 44399]MDT0264316.1 MobF family relaxase [Jatrophihabitans sp. DSM 44399]